MVVSYMHCFDSFYEWVYVDCINEHLLSEWKNTIFEDANLVA